MATRKTKLNLGPCCSAAKRVARNHGLRVDAAEDVAQATAAVVLRKYADRPTGELARIAAGVAHRVILKLREKAARNHRALELLAGRPRAGAESAAEQQLSIERRALLHRAIKSLPESDRDLLRLRFSTGMTNGEIGKLLGCSANVVKVRISRATDHLERKVRSLDGRST